jgi:hypothetical protein
MTGLDSSCFIRCEFSKKQIDAYFNSAKNSMSISKQTEIPEVIFKFSYDSLIKLGISIIAYKGYRIKSVVGHHMKIIELLSEILSDDEVNIIGNLMRRERNRDLYDGGAVITHKQSIEYLQFVENVFKKVAKIT